MGQSFIGTRRNIMFVLPVTGLWQTHTPHPPRPAGIICKLNYVAKVGKILMNKL